MDRRLEIYHCRVAAKCVATGFSWGTSTSCGDGAKGNEFVDIIRCTVACQTQRLRIYY